MKSDDSALAWVAIDFLCCILLVVYTLIAPPPKPTQIATLGKYAVTLEWPAGYESDVDLYVKTPSGTVVFFANSDGRTVTLEHDDLGLPDARNRERAVIRELERGEYIVNVFAYRLREPRVPVIVTLWRLEGADTQLRVTHLSLEREGQELTVFRFRPPKTFSDLPARFVG